MYVTRMIYSIIEALIPVLAISAIVSYFIINSINKSRRVHEENKLKADIALKAMEMGQQVKFQCAKPATVCLFWKEYFWQQVKISLCGPCVGRCVCLQ